MYYDESKSELARDLDDRIQSQNVPYGTSDDLYIKHLRGRGHMGIINGVYASAEIFSEQVCLKILILCRKSQKQLLEIKSM